MSNTRTTFSDHYILFRKQLIIAVCVIMVLFIGFALIAKRLYTWLALPLLAQLPHDGHMIATSVITPVLTPLQFAFYLALFIGIPIIAIQAWWFAAPGLTRSEKNQSIGILVSAITLFYAGLWFAYGFIFPSVFMVFAMATPEHVMLMPDIQTYLSFALQTLLVFGFVFQLPLILTVLIGTDLVSPEACRSQRKIILIVALTVGMLITPPDVISQVLVAIPLCLLYELGILVGQCYRRYCFKTAQCDSITKQEK
jgi:sec-independent protein translocase protein TatC